MLRILIAIMAVAVLAAPVAAYETDWHFPSGGSEDGIIDIYLMVNCFVQIDWQDTEIHFDGASDWWSWNLMGDAYASLSTEPDGQVPTSAWAGDHWYAPNGIYYESADGADIYVSSNNALSMMVHTNGDLKATDPLCEDCYIPTWFTLALSGPFYVEGQQIGLATIPGDGTGSYVHPIPPGTAGGDLGYDDLIMGIYPDQYAFACAPASQEWYLGPLCPNVSGNMKFLARIHRNGMLDAGGDYSTFLDVHFASPTFGP